MARRVDGIHIAIDLDCLDRSGGWAVTMPEPNGLALETAVAAVSEMEIRCREEAEAREELGPARDPDDGLDMDRMNREEEPRNERRGP